MIFDFGQDGKGARGRIFAFRPEEDDGDSDFMSTSEYRDHLRLQIDEGMHFSGRHSVLVPAIVAVLEFRANGKNRHSPFGEQASRRGPLAILG